MHAFGDQIPGTVVQLIWIGAATLLALIVIFLLVTTAVYRQSQIIITNKTITQVTQRGLFSRKVSQLSLEDIEDVNADTPGMMASTVNYGTLNVQTAGEVENFTFTMCPKVNEVAKTIIECRQELIEKQKQPVPPTP